MSTQISIEKLAEALNGKLWIKDDKKRIYLECGYNTKKMSTKTYVFQREDGTYGVSCFIECPSQPYQWIKSQQEEVIEGVLSDIERVEADTYYLVVDNETGMYLDDNRKKIALNGCDYFLSENAAQKWMKAEYVDNCTVVAMPRDEFEKIVAELDAIDQIERDRLAALKALEPKPFTAYTGEMFGVGSSVQHARFGIGTVTSEDATRIEIKFESGQKQLSKQFASLTKIEANATSN